MLFSFIYSYCCYYYYYHYCYHYSNIAVIINVIIFISVIIITMIIIFIVVVIIIVIIIFIIIIIWNTLEYSYKLIESKKVGCLRYILDKIRHWFQFADDTDITTALEGDKQLLSNVFTKWTSWADLVIRIDKCHNFGMKKSATGSIQYLQYVIVQRERIPPTEVNESFFYFKK